MIHKMNIKGFVALVALLFAAFVMVGCIRESAESMPNEPTTMVTLPISIKALATGSEPVTDGELAINEVRVYAFTGDKLAGHYYYSGDAVSKISFLLDLTLYASTTQSVMLYAIANESSFLPFSNTTSLNASTSEAVLKSLYFSHIDVKAGLPMFFASPISLNVADDAVAMPEDVVNGDEHASHTVLAETVSLQLERPMSKIELYAAKQSGESAELRVTGVRADKQGVRMRNYLMPQSVATLEVLQPYDTDQELMLTSPSVLVSSAMPAGYASASEDEKHQMRVDKQNYTALLAAPYYAFENPYGSNNPLMAEATGKGAILHVDYEFNGVARSAQVHMPALERNTHYPVYCLFNNEGKMQIDYIVAPWQESEENVSWGEISFDYPTYSSPVLPLDESAVRPFAKPVMWYTAGSEEGAFSCRFIMWAPVGQQWTAVVDAPASDYEVRVYDKLGNLQPDATVTVVAGLLPTDWYTIKVIPLRNLNVAGVEEQVKFHIIYTPSWMHHADYLLINGEQENPAYLDSGLDPETIFITQIEQP